MNRTAEELASTIAALDAQRAILGDAVVDMAVAPLRSALQALQSRPPVAAQQLKQVSVLFVDVVGSTAMGQQLGPEEIHAVMDGALQRFTTVVQALRGRVLQYTGDGMLAAFGSEDAGEDDVERAVLAGLAVIDEAKRHAPEVRRVHGVPDFNVRAGVHTGTVLLGGGVDAEGSIRGAAVNVAARMEQSAAPGCLRISHDSYRHVSGLFDVVEQAPISVKGVDQPLRTYLVERARPRSFRIPTRGIEGVQTRMVGREAHLGALQAAFQTAVHDRQAQAVTVVGDAGIGKSRLLAEFEQTLDRQACWLLHGRAHPRSAVQPFGLLRDLVARQFEIAEADPAEVACAKLVDGLSPLFAADGGEAPIHLFGHLIGFDFSTSEHVAEVVADAVNFKARAFDAGALILRRLSELRPVVFELDDLHWSDAGSLEFMHHLLHTNDDTPLLGLMLSRPTLFDQHASWFEGEANHQRVDLQPLDKASSRELASALLQRLESVPAALNALLTGSAEGNPFYMEELVKMLIDDGVIEARPDGWRVLPDKLLAARVPPTLTGVLQARLDALAPPERLALQHAAIVGHVFSAPALASIDDAASQVLPALLKKQLIVRHHVPGLDEASEYAFQHNLLHQVTYDGVLKAPKRAAHTRVGQFWSARAEVAAPRDVNPAACRALAEAQYHRCKVDAQAYVGWFEGQFSNYLNAYAARTLRPLTEQLIEICEAQFGAEHPQTAKALTNVARVIIVQGAVAEAEPLLRRAIDIQQASLPADHPDTARTLAVLGGYHQQRGDMHKAEPFFQRALAVREKVLGPEHPLTLGTLDNLAKVTLELGRLDEAEHLSRRVLAVRERIDGADHPDTAFAMTALGEILAKKGAFEDAEPLIRRALAVQSKSLPAGHPDTGLSMWHLGETLRALHRLEEAEQWSRQALEIWETSFGPDHEWTAWGLIGLAETRLARGDGVEAAALAERALTALFSAYGADHAVLQSTRELRARALQASDGLSMPEPMPISGL